MTKLNVKGMTCNHCVKAVTDALAAVPEVTDVVSVNLEQGTAEVAGAASVAALIAAIKEAGYEATAS